MRTLEELFERWGKDSPFVYAARNWLLQRPCPAYSDLREEALVMLAHTLLEERERLMIELLKAKENEGCEHLRE